MNSQNKKYIKLRKRCGYLKMLRMPLKLVPELVKYRCGNGFSFFHVIENGPESPVLTETGAQPKTDELWLKLVAKTGGKPANKRSPETGFPGS